MGPTASVDSTKENLSRSSSSSNSVSANDLSRIGNAGGGSGGVKTSTATLRMSNSGNRPGGIGGSRAGGNVTNRRATASSSLSFMKPTASSAKKFSSVADDLSPASTRYFYIVESARTLISHMFFMS